MKGFIFLHRSIMSNWIWQQPYRFQRWCDLIFWAAWKDCTTQLAGNKITLKRGQIATGVRALMRRWGTNNTTVYNTLQIFEEMGMIKVKKTKEYILISVINYDKYQSKYDDFFDENDIENHSFEDDFLDEKKHPFNTNSQHDRVHQRVHERIINNKINNLERDSARVRARNKVFDDFFKQGIQVEAFCMQNNIDIDTCKKIAKEVINDWELTDQEHNNEKDAKSHFLNVMRIKISEHKKQQNNARRNNNNATREDGPNPLQKARVAQSVEA